MYGFIGHQALKGWDSILISTVASEQSSKKSMNVTDLIFYFTERSCPIDFRKKCKASWLYYLCFNAYEKV